MTKEKFVLPFPLKINKHLGTKPTKLTCTGGGTLSVCDFLCKDDACGQSSS